MLVLIQHILPIQQKVPYLQICIASAFVMADPQKEIEGEQKSLKLLKYTI